MPANITFDTRVDPVESEYSVIQFMNMFCKTFPVFPNHIVSFWYLTNVKLELQKPLASRSSILFITTNFAENVLIVRKHELSDQYFHRIEILLFGAVASFVTTMEMNDPVLKQYSYLVSSDYRYLI